ncbi:gluconate 2-dehydrogenase subunit 3 family protein [Alteromonas sp. KUL49]|uniref:gluconate 2-dehydrogenase subunit 3 family protein n=1 Tax=Alteromonas sp. KUL49 TaxID=2480798 RepID=UPI00102F2848|nr:gluconate 2-dehydrogenase subunit 3 family protein [Alteromonas sp. KUL49]TAP38021.1 gluconate 2-dehydrogenase subunit 3 family protein [Alteromonas sp. KUL49]GEA12895.1 twin-arginine translocation pathway signal protein [Alteromonas sp. KUL49]
MDRRDLLKFIGAATGVAFVSSHSFAWDDHAPVSLASTGFTESDVALFNEMAEVIIPQTDTPGAKAANVGQIITVLVADCYPAVIQKAFVDGIQAIRERAVKDYGKDFLLLSGQERLALFSTLDKEANAYNRENHINDYIASERPSRWEPGSEGPVPHHFTLLKQLTLFGFFTSRPGATQVLRYVAIPGRYDGAYPFKKGDKAWAT